jgi:hypothetical protein
VNHRQTLRAAGSAPNGLSRSQPRRCLPTVGAQSPEPTARSSASFPGTAQPNLPARLLLLLALQRQEGSPLPRRISTGGPTGRPWRRVRARVLAASDVCYLCGHPGAGAVDHVISRKLRPDLALDPANLRPVHGSLSRCPWCKRACNEAKGDRAGLPGRQQPRQSRRW